MGKIRVIISNIGAMTTKLSPEEMPIAYGNRSQGYYGAS